MLEGNSTQLNEYGNTNILPIEQCFDQMRSHEEIILPETDKIASCGMIYNGYIFSEIWG